MTEQPDEDQTTDESTETASTTTESSSSDSSNSESGGSASRDVEPGEPGEVTDAQLPEDLQPGEDNPLATHPDQTGNDDDQIGADREEDPETAPLTADEADYGSGAGGSSSGTDGGTSSGGDGTGDGRVGSEEDDGSDTLDNGGGGAG
ncbi:hypothetical protein ASG49_03555 [Marmoricola sp. Leaf446]|uniref:hypothetical protein n=1 Tax=Marmoricola sp. Leaf446 TaxID=1736379 RepID=UPI000700CE24|nr:hypothetical protein [Marmoricola sp. Leaf446]KQT94017.1 hypothetical protein ASG49_03555 [Marmoricola sp. Leaf446]